MDIKQIANLISEDIDLISENDQLEGVKSEVKRVVEKLIRIFDTSGLPRQQAMQLLTSLIQEVAQAGNLSKAAVHSAYQSYNRQASSQQPTKAQPQAVQTPVAGVQSTPQQQAAQGR